MSAEPQGARRMSQIASSVMALVFLGEMSGMGQDALRVSYDLLEQIRRLRDLSFAAGEQRGRERKREEPCD